MNGLHQAQPGFTSPNHSTIHDDQVLYQQLRLTFLNIRSSLPFGIIAICLLSYVLFTNGNSFGISVWFFASLSMRVICHWHTRKMLSGALQIENIRQVAWQLIGLNFFMGAAWGSLPWAAMAPDSMSNVLLIHVAFLGISTSTMMMLATYFPAFLASLLIQSMLLASKYLSLSEPVYQTLLIFVPLLLASVLIHGRNIGNATRDAIRLRFENMALIAKLKKETQHANEEHQQAVQANHAKTQFLAAASHDLRQPMHALGLFLEVLERSGLTLSQQETLKHARAVSSASSSMLNTLLDYSRIEAGAVHCHQQPFLLQGLLHKIENELGPQANARNLVYRCPDTTLAVDSDPDLIEMILRNLVTNAIRYTHKGGILIACRKRGSTVWLEVWDTGVGIAPEQQQEIFREFHQLGNPERDREKGLGLGLAIVDGMLKKLGIPLILKSRPGRGSVFKIGIPLSSTPQLSQSAEFMYAASLELQKTPALQTESVAITEMTESQACSESCSRIISPSSLKILLIDDDAAVRMSMQQLLQSWGSECICAEDQAAALQSLGMMLPDFIISDYRLRAERSGTQAIAAVRQACNALIPALLLTGDTSPERWQEALQSNITIVHKPLTSEQLWQQISLELKRSSLP